MVYHINNLEETALFADSFASLINYGDFFAFRGDLGSGKTTFVSSVLKSIGYTGEVTSPTFNIVHEYDSIPPVYHFDLYRIEDEEELYFIGFDDYLTNDAVIFCEWSERLCDYLPNDAITIDIKKTGENSRTIEIIGDERFEDIEF